MSNVSETKPNLNSHTYLYRVATPYRPPVSVFKSVRHGKNQVQNTFPVTQIELTEPIDISTLKQWDTSQFVISTSISENLFSPHSSVATDFSHQEPELGVSAENTESKVKVHDSRLEIAAHNLPQDRSAEQFLSKYPYLTWAGICTLSVGLFFTFLQLWTWEEANTIVIFTSLLSFLLGITFLLRILPTMNWRYCIASILWSGFITYGSLGASAIFSK